MNSVSNWINLVSKLFFLFFKKCINLVSNWMNLVSNWINSVSNKWINSVANLIKMCMEKERKN